jgi:ParB family transcriptional regulator, chromosome partitioning protein
MALIENIQREDLNAIEEAQALERLQDEFKLTHQQVADVIGKSRTTVSNLLRLNQLADGVKRLVETKQLEMGHARALLMLEGDQQIEIAQRVAAKQLTVRQTEQLVKKCLTQPSEDGSASEDLDAQQMSQRVSEMLGAKVSIIRSKGGKAKMTISLDEPHKLEQLIAKLES